jgi:hypothetical protein
MHASSSGDKSSITVDIAEEQELRLKSELLGLS